jgi:hypothetical protein
VNAVFSRGFKADLVREEARYAEISERLSGDFHERVAGLVREVIKWKGGDHIGPHGFPCRRAKPFPFYVYSRAKRAASSSGLRIRSPRVKRLP